METTNFLLPSFLCLAINFIAHFLLRRRVCHGQSSKSDFHLGFIHFWFLCFSQNLTGDSRALAMNPFRWIGRYTDNRCRFAAGWGGLPVGLGLGLFSTAVKKIQYLMDKQTHSYSFLSGQFVCYVHSLSTNRNISQQQFGAWSSDLHCSLDFTAQYPPQLQCKPDFDDLQARNECTGERGGCWNL